MVDLNARIPLLPKLIRLRVLKDEDVVRGVRVRDVGAALERCVHELGASVFEHFVGLGGSILIGLSLGMVVVALMELGKKLAGGQGDPQWVGFQTIAALRPGLLDLADRRVAIVTTGRNVSVETLRSVLE